MNELERVGMMSMVIVPMVMVPMMIAVYDRQERMEARFNLFTMKSSRTQKNVHRADGRASKD